jgi:hypothetical protein
MSYLSMDCKVSIQGADHASALHQKCITVVSPKQASFEMDDASKAIEFGRNECAIIHAKCTPDRGASPQIDGIVQTPRVALSTVVSSSPRRRHVTQFRVAGSCCNSWLLCIAM